MQSMIQLITLEHYPIFEQLKLEEALLRTSKQNFCLINVGSPPAIVMGISADPAQVIDAKNYSYMPVPVIRRYSGGGTVVVESTTLFVTWILNHDAIPADPFPSEVLKWTEAFYKPFSPFTLKENDYVIGDKKCGGNAQYFVKGRFVHHTSFLWDYTSSYMQLLKIPPKMPLYRASRSHNDFICTLKEHFSSPYEFVNRLINNLPLPHQFLALEQATYSLQLPHRSTSQLITYLG